MNISEPVLRNAARLASERGVTLSAIVEDAMRAQLVRKEPFAAPSLRLHTVRGRLVRRELDLDQTSALIALDDETEFAGRG